MEHPDGIFNLKKFVISFLVSTLLIALAMGSVTTPSLSQQQTQASLQNNVKNATDTEQGEQLDRQNNNTTATLPQNENNTLNNNQTSATANQTTTAVFEEERNELARRFFENITSGDNKVIMITMSRQRDVPVEQEQRDFDPLGLLNFTGQGTGTLRIIQPDYASGQENQTSTLYTGGVISFMFENLTIQPPDDIDVLLISQHADAMVTPEQIDDTGEDNLFVIPQGLRSGENYLVLVSFHFADLHRDVLMGINGRAIQLQTE